MTDEADVGSLADAVLGDHGHVDVLVNNVGDHRPLVPFRRSSPESWQAMYDVNLFHFFAVTHAFLDSMIEHGRRLDRQRALGRGDARATRAIPSTAP